MWMEWNSGGKLVSALYLFNAPINLEGEGVGHPPIILTGPQQALLGLDY